MPGFGERGVAGVVFDMGRFSRNCVGRQDGNRLAPSGRVPTKIAVGNARYRRSRCGEEWMRSTVACLRRRSALDQARQAQPG